MQTFNTMNLLLSANFLCCDQGCSSGVILVTAPKHMTDSRNLYTDWYIRAMMPT